jgi:hypothetical protein
MKSTPEINADFKPLAVWRAYVPLALRTEPKLETIQKWWGVTTASNTEEAQAWLRLNHATVGMATEADEMCKCATEEHWIEECGDAAWYAAQAFAALEVLAKVHAQPLVWQNDDLNEFAVPATHQLIGSLRSFVQDAKRLMFYQQADRVPRLSSRLTDIILGLHTVGSQNVQVQDFEGLLESNLIKLKKRYPDGYSDWHARVREDKKPGEDDVDP